MDQQLRIEDIQTAWNVHDPDLPELIISLAAQSDPELRERMKLKVRSKANIS